MTCGRREGHKWTASASEAGRDDCESCRQRESESMPGQGRGAGRLSLGRDMIRVVARDGESGGIRKTADELGGRVTRETEGGLRGEPQGSRAIASSKQRKQEQAARQTRKRWASSDGQRRHNVGGVVGRQVQGAAIREIGDGRRGCPECPITRARLAVRCCCPSRPRPPA